MPPSVMDLEQLVAATAVIGYWSQHETLPPVVPEAGGQAQSPVFRHSPEKPWVHTQVTTPGGSLSRLRASAAAHHRAIVVIDSPTPAELEELTASGARVVLPTQDVWERYAEAFPRWASETVEQVRGSRDLVQYGRFLNHLATALPDAEMDKLVHSWGATKWRVVRMTPRSDEVQARLDATTKAVADLRSAIAVGEPQAVVAAVKGLEKLQESITGLLANGVTQQRLAAARSMHGSDAVAAPATATADALVRPSGAAESVVSRDPATAAPRSPGRPG